MKHMKEFRPSLILQLKNAPGTGSVSNSSKVTQLVSGFLTLIFSLQC